VVAELPLPIGGFIADCSIEEAAEKMHHIRENLYGLGCTLSNPYLTIQTLSGTFLPYFRITQKGLVNIKEKKLVDLVHNP
jgi:adenine deaminase